MKKFIAFTVIACALFSACSEETETFEEFPNWLAKNTAYFEKQYQAHEALNDGSILTTWTLDSIAAESAKHTECILIERLEQGQDTVSPFYTDTVTVHYSGRLLPSATHSAGYVFDQSFDEPFDSAVAVPTQFAVNNVVKGFSTALQHMHRGDRWRVTIPYQLGYGVVATSSIPAYSTLIFDIRLVDFWSTKKGDR